MCLTALGAFGIICSPFKIQGPILPGFSYRPACQSRHFYFTRHSQEQGEAYLKAQAKMKETVGHGTPGENLKANSCRERDSLQDCPGAARM